MLINTSRGALIDTEPVVDALKDGRIGYLGLDVYEEEGDLFFKDPSDQVILRRYVHPASHLPQRSHHRPPGFFTHGAMVEIAETTLANIDGFAARQTSGNEVGPSALRG